MTPDRLGSPVFKTASRGGEPQDQNRLPSETQKETTNTNLIQGPIHVWKPTRQNGVKTQTGCGITLVDDVPFIKEYSQRTHGEEHDLLPHNI